jgi:hypothetical protein
MPQRDFRSTNLRSKGNFIPFPFKGVKFSKTFFPYFTKKWNQLPPEAKKSSTEDFKKYINENLKPKRYRFYSRGNKIKCKLLTRIRVGRSLLNSHQFTLGFTDTPSCACSYSKETPLHYITQCPYFTDARRRLFGQVQKFIPNISRLTKLRQYEILVLGYDIHNEELRSINTKIMIATQNFIQETKRFQC